MAGFEELATAGPEGAAESFEFEDSPFIGVSKDFRNRNPRYGAPGQTIREAEFGRGSQPFMAPRYTRSTLESTIRDTSPETIYAMQTAMAKAGFIGPKTRFAVGVWDEPTVSAYKKLLGFANRNNVDEVQALELYANARAAGLDLDGDGQPDEGGGAPEEQPFTGTKRRRDTSVNLSDPTTARKLVRDLFREKLGRGPKKGEYEAFVGALNAAEQRAPQVSDTATSYVDGEATGTSTTTSGGMNAAGFAEEYAQQGEVGEEANTFMVATDYYDAAMQALRSPV